jgi:hypothetical protein
MALLGSLFASPATAWASELLRLKPLPKRHYYWPTYGKWPTDFHAEQIVRITRTASLSGEYEKEADAKKMLQWAKAHDAVVGINYSIWARVFPKDAAPTENYDAAVKELKIFADRLQLIKAWANQYSVPVGAVLLDSEVFRVQGDDLTSDWNQAITQKYNAAYLVVKRIFPKAVVEWWGSGWQRSAAPSGWSVSPHFTFKEKRDSLSCSLYAVPEIEGMRETYRRTVELADSLNIQRVTPWVALACGFRRDMEVMQKWSDHWDYELIYDWTLGRELNIRWFGDRPERFSHYNRAEHVVFYPQPYRNPDWEKHFIAYVLGASGAKKLSLNS